MDVYETLARQDNLVTWKQMRDAGLSERRALTLVATWQKLHDGVWLAAYAPPTLRQRQRAATLTTEGSVLADRSAADLHGLRWYRRGDQQVVRPGQGGPAHRDGVRVRYSLRLERQDITTIEGIVVTTVERTIIDLSRQLGARDLRKLVREAIRLKKTTTGKLQTALSRHRGARGVAELRELVERYDRLKLGACRSDAEAYALEVLDRAGLPLPLINHDVGGEEADLCWPDLKLIIELDGGQWHVLTDEDARKTAAWHKAGFSVRRLATDDLFADAECLLALALANGVKPATAAR